MVRCVMRRRYIGWYLWLSDQGSLVRMRHIARNNYSVFYLNKLIHLTRRQEADVSACTEIPGFDGKPVPNLRVLGIWVDSKLKWLAHVAEAARKGHAQFEALSGLVGSTWRLTFTRARTIYTTVVRPTTIYGCQIWAAGDKGKGLPNSTIKPLVQLQSKCLRKITGAYKTRFHYRARNRHKHHAGYKLHNPTGAQTRDPQQ